MGRKYEPWWEFVLVHALVASIWTCPEPTIFTFFNSLNEELAHFVGRGLLVAFLGEHNRFQFLLVPIFRSLRFLLSLFLLPRVLVQIFLLAFPFDVQIV